MKNVKAYLLSREMMNSELIHLISDSLSESLVVRDKDSGRYFDDDGLESSSRFRGKD